MKTPWFAGRVLPAEEFEGYCREAMRAYCPRGIRLEDYKDALLDFPLLMQPGVWPKLAKLTEKLTEEVLAAERELFSRPDLYAALGVSAEIESILRLHPPGGGHKALPRVMRFDLYYTTEGWKFSEANPDTPGGYVEAYGYTAPMAAYYPGFVSPPNPAAAHADAVRRVVGKNGRIAVVMNGDDRYGARQLVSIVREIEKRGMRAIVVGPAQVTWKSGRARIVRSGSSTATDLVMRQVIIERMLERVRRSDWAEWLSGAGTPVSNPGYCILTESKRLPCVLDELDSRVTMFRSHLPETRSPDEIPISSQSDWVFKPAYGVTGKGIAIAGVTGKAAFKAAAERARRHPDKWVAQRRFESVAVPTERGPGHICLGIYTVDGVAAGVWARIKGTPFIDRRSLSIPVLIPERDLRSS
jgi:Glutathionylspermidine synthase preATP-grasp